MKWLIDAFIRARNSTIKRVKDLSEEQLDFHSKDKVSIRDISWHIALCDNSAIKPLQSDIKFNDRLYPGLAMAKSKQELLQYLDQQLTMKCDIISRNLDRLTEKTRHLDYGEITIGEAILCSGIDHEAHHRGQIALIRKESGI